MGAMGAVMRAKKPDWAQRMVQKLLEDCTALPEADGWIAIKRHDLESLLRVRHRKVKRMVQKLNQDSAHLYINCDEISAYRLACEHIMDKLKELER